jgi:uncharacterized lipoprotein YmbA
MIQKITIVLTALLLLAGCTANSSFYQLHPKVKESTQSRSHQKGTVIGIAEGEGSEYLNKPEIVTRLSAGRLSVHEDDRWAGSFPKNLQAVLRHNLATLQPRYTFLSYPWEEPIDDNYRIYVTIDRFDGDAAGLVTLEGRWSLVDRNESKVLFSENIKYAQKGGTSLDAIVDTQSRLLYKLSQRISTKVRSKI